MIADTGRRGDQSGGKGMGARPGASRPTAPRPGAPRPGASRAVKRASRRGPSFGRPRLALGRANYALVTAGVVSAILGFVLLRDRDISLAPILIVLGYCVLVPAGLLIEHVPGRKRTDASGGPSEGE